MRPFRRFCSLNHGFSADTLCRELIKLQLSAVAISNPAANRKTNAQALLLHAVAVSGEPGKSFRRQLGTVVGHMQHIIVSFTRERYAHEPFGIFLCGMRCIANEVEDKELKLQGVTQYPGRTIVLGIGSEIGARSRVNRHPPRIMALNDQFRPPHNCSPVGGFKRFGRSFGIPAHSVDNGRDAVGFLRHR